MKNFSGSGKLTLREWWPNLLYLKILYQNPPELNPYGRYFDYAQEFAKLDLDQVKEDLRKVMTESKDWWPADYGHYGPLMIRLAWHSAGTYRAFDGRGGAKGGLIRFAPLIGWPDNVNLDKAIRLLWPVKKKYGKKISWADLIILAGNVALESMGFKTYGFAGGREDWWEPDESTYWGPEVDMLQSERHDERGVLYPEVAAEHMGLIYVNPEGPRGNPDPKEAVKEIRMVFARMAMNDEETVALIAGGHSFGKAHGAALTSYLGPEPPAAPIENQGLGWVSSYKSGKGPDTITSGIEVIWTPTPTKWNPRSYFHMLLTYEYELEKGPGGCYQWVAKDAPEIIPAPYDPNKKHKPRMLTTDIALKVDPVYNQICRKFLENPEEFERAFAKAWFKLTHRDLGPRALYLGKEIPQEVSPWEDPLPEIDFKLPEEKDIVELKKEIRKAIAEGKTTVSDLVYVAWSSAATFRISDKRGGANGAKIMFEPLRSFVVNMPERLNKVLRLLEEIKKDFDLKNQNDGKKISMADLIILAGDTGIEVAAERAGYIVNIPFFPGRVDTKPEFIDTFTAKFLEPIYDGFRNYLKSNIKFVRTPEELLIDRAHLLALTPPEMTALVGGLRVLNCNFNYSPHGVFTKRPECLTNDFFVNLLNEDLEWKEKEFNLYEGRSRKTGELKWTATRVDLIFGHDHRLRALSEAYASDDGEEVFIKNFLKGWIKVMHLDRFDLHKERKLERVLENIIILPKF